MLTQKTLIQLLLLSCITLTLIAFPAWTAPQEQDPETELETATNALSLDDIEQLELRLLTDPPIIDGELSDEFWSFATKTKINLEMYPSRFAKAVIDTDVLIAMTDSHVYLAFIAYDQDISKIRSAPRDHDGVKKDDYVSVIFDASGNLSKKYEFRVNPHGSKSDVLQNTVSDRYIYDWDTTWDASAKINKNNWIVEMAIPLDSLKEPLATEGERNKWVMILKRNYPRKIDRSLGAVFIVEPSALRNIEMVANSKEPKNESFLSKGMNLSAHPYAIYHLNEERDYGQAFEQIDETSKFDVGADFILTLNNATTMSVTVNPNFTDVEADIARDSINNTFNIFQPEKRRFFQEGMELYSTLMPLVYTRNIIAPEVGASISHQAKKYSFGSFWSDDEQTTLLAPDNLGSKEISFSSRQSKSMAARMVRAEKGSAWGLMATHRFSGNYNNSVVAADGLVNLGIDDKLRYQIAASKTQYIDDFAEDLCEEDGCLDNDDQDECELGYCDTNSYVQRVNHDDSIEGYAIQIKYKHTGPKSLYWANYFNVSRDFRADLGFMKKVDYQLYNLAYGRNWYFEALSGDGGKSRGRVYLVATQVESQDNEKIETGYEIWGEFRGSYQSVIRPGYRIKERAVNRIDQDSLMLKGNAPKFDESYFQWFFETSPYPNWTFHLDGRVGEIADADNLVLGDMKEFKPRISYQLGQFKLDLRYTERRYAYESKELYQENFTTVGVNWRPNDTRQVRLLVKYDKTTRDIARWRGEELANEEEFDIELTHTRYLSKNLSFISGIKFTRESDSEINDTYTTDRQFYLRVNYQMDFSGND